jgi:hypothetical protein
MRRALDEHEAEELTPVQADELAFAVSILADVIEKAWAKIKEGPVRGTSSRRIVPHIERAHEVVEDALRTCVRFRTKVERAPAHTATHDMLAGLAENAERVRRVLLQLRELLDWLKAPPPPADLEKLKALEAGPFVSLEELRARRSS